MSSKVYRTLLRTIYGSVLNSNLSVSELKALSMELRRGRLADELAYMIDSVIQNHLGTTDNEGRVDTMVEEAERLVRSRRLPKAMIISVMESLGHPPPSNNESVHRMLEWFMNEAPSSRINAFIEILAGPRVGDDFLAGISKVRK